MDVLAGHRKRICPTDLQVQGRPGDSPLGTAGGETFGLPDSTFRRILPQLQPGNFVPGHYQ